MPRFGLPSFLLLVGALNAAIVAVLLLRGRAHRHANWLLAALLAVIASRLVPFILGYAGFYDAYPWLSFAPLDHPLAIGPLVWLYVHQLTTGAMPRRWWWHLIPAGLKAVTWTVIFVGASVAQKTAIDSAFVEPLEPWLTGAALLGLFGYGAAALRRLRSYQHWLDGEFSNREEFRLGWLRFLLIAMALTGIISLVVAFVELVVAPLDYWDVFPQYLWLSVLAYGLGLGAWRNANVVYPIPSRAVRTEPPMPEAAPSADWRALGDGYLCQLREGEWWRDPQLTLPRLAQRLGASPTAVSRALNLGLGQSFNECVNRLRVEGVQAAIRAGNPLDLVQLGFEAGFNSKASFQRAFRRYADTTPSAYRAAQQAAEAD
jgi:AraC-like DNA-binding protein